MKSSNQGFLLIGVSFAIASTVTGQSALAADDKADPNASPPIAWAVPLPAEAPAPEHRSALISVTDAYQRRER